MIYDLCFCVLFQSVVRLREIWYYWFLGLVPCSNLWRNWDWIETISQLKLNCLHDNDQVLLGHFLRLLCQFMVNYQQLLHWFASLGSRRGWPLPMWLSMLASLETALRSLRWHRICRAFVGFAHRWAPCWGTLLVACLFMLLELRCDSLSLSLSEMGCSDFCYGFCYRGLWGFWQFHLHCWLC